LARVKIFWKNIFDLKNYEFSHFKTLDFKTRAKDFKTLDLKTYLNKPSRVASFT